jgi:hypothetical protein
METLMGLIVGIGLSAACGFRVFVPLLGLSMASMCGHVTLAPGFEWIGTGTAFFTFSVATVLEIGAFYIPWLDHLLDVIATPAAIVAGSIMTASMVGDMTPFLRWSMAIIAGGGAAGIIQTGTVVGRAASTATTGGFGNFIISTIELIGAVLTTILAILLPVLCLIMVVWIASKMLKKVASSPLFKKLVT